MILTNEMLWAAFDLRRAAPWKKLTDSDIFAVKLSSGEIGYCSVMGHGGEHYALGLYIGRKGFTSYLNSLYLNNAAPFVFQQLAMMFDCINCDFMNAADMDAKTKSRIRAFVAHRGLKIQRPHGWPDFTRHSPYRMQWDITDEQDAQFITEALHAALYMTKMSEASPLSELGFDPMGEYPTKEGGKMVPLLTPQLDGTYLLGVTPLPAYQGSTYSEAPFENDLLSHQIGKLPNRHTISCLYTNLPAPTGSGEEEAPFFPEVLLCVDEDSGMVVHVEMSERQGDTLKLLTGLGNALLSLGYKPSEILINTERTESLLGDFCRRCDIGLRQEPVLPELEEVYQEFLYNLCSR